jgi:hypothetical protein
MDALNSRFTDGMGVAGSSEQLRTTALHCFISVPGTCCTRALFKLPGWLVQPEATVRRLVKWYRPILGPRLACPAGTEDSSASGICFTGRGWELSMGRGLVIHGRSRQRLAASR